MPLYEYRCKNCGNDFEKLVSFSQASTMPECPGCHGVDTEKKVSQISSFASAGYSSGGASSCGGSGGFT